MNYLLPINDYDQIILTLSGGKDSIAASLHILQQVEDKSKIVVWHQCIDGHGETMAKKHLWDWECTEGYVEAFCKHFGLKLYWQWREGGFERELLKNNQSTGDVYMQSANRPLPMLDAPSDKSRKNTRMKFPAKTASLMTRWCSAALKIDVARRCITNLYREPGIKILYVSGERWEESPARAKLKPFELHACNTQGRLVHHYRPVIDWSETKVWNSLESDNIQPHPVYYLGLPRVSCKRCIFFSPDHWATLYDVDKQAVLDLANLEIELGFTVDNKKSIMQMVESGTSQLRPEYRQYAELALKPWTYSVLADKWALPPGAYGKGGGSI